MRTSYKIYYLCFTSEPSFDVDINEDGSVFLKLQASIVYNIGNYARYLKNSARIIEFTRKRFNNQSKTSIHKFNCTDNQQE